jgi:hypothetical protein
MSAPVASVGRSRRSVTLGGGAVTAQIVSVAVKVEREAVGHAVGSPVDLADAPPQAAAPMRERHASKTTRVSFMHHRHRTRTTPFRDMTLMLLSMPVVGL